MRYNSSAALFLLIILFITPLCAQNDTPFTAEQKIYTKGNSVLIGNTILGNHPEQDFDDVKTLNDQVSLKFVDIDEDINTFSSSAATFELPSTANKIMYAGLYWGGLYPAKSASKSNGRRRIKYTYDGERNERVQDIQIKINNSDYKEILGQVIFDSQAKGPFAKESPYACYADVTSQLALFKGEVIITIANVKATTGYIEGGAAAGWLLYLVYEDDTQTPKYFTSYSGFKEVSKEEVEVVFEELQPKNENTSSSKILMAALEGDTKIKGDACAIYSDSKEQFIPLSTEGRPAKNFFNSTVSVGHTVPTKRIPASKNTLGFDLIKMDVPDNTITANTTDATIRLSTKQDRFYTFFLAFETEISAQVLETQTAVTKIMEGKIEAKEVKPDGVKGILITTNPKVINSGPPPIYTEPVATLAQKDPLHTNEVKSIATISKPQSEKNGTARSSEKLKHNSTNLSKEEKTINDEISYIKKRKSVTSRELVPGYYVVTNVFKNKSNATKWKSRLINEGYDARTFFNDKNQAVYVYIKKGDDLIEILNYKEVIRKTPHLEKTWVCPVNL